MRGIKPSLALASLGVLGLALWAGAQFDRTGSAMAVAADRLLDALDDAQKAKATFAFDSPERTNWHYIPRERKGLPVKEMNGEQRALAFGLLSTGLDASGYLKATTIMSLEAVLRDLEQGSGPTRDPELYFFSLFGEPSDRGEWGWRVEGHHVSINVTLRDGAIASATPAFFGANPAEVREGPRKGLRTLAEREDRALRLVQALDGDRKGKAIAADEAPADIKTLKKTGDSGGLSVEPPDYGDEGIAYDELDDDQRAMLRALVESYAVDMPREVAVAWLEGIKEAGPEKVRFAWYGPADRSKPHGYAVHGPSFLIEFNNTQNGANHIHSVWRNRLGDFGKAGDAP